MSQFSDLGKTPYISIESFGKDGRTIRTPVWITSEDCNLFCWTLANSGKVKRIRNNSRVRLAPCDAAGNTKGVWVAANARVLDSPQDIKAQAQRMSRKFGLKFLLFRLLPLLRGTKPVAIEFRSAPDEPSTSD